MIQRVHGYCALCRSRCPECYKQRTDRWTSGWWKGFEKPLGGTFWEMTLSVVEDAVSSPSSPTQRILRARRSAPRAGRPRNLSTPPKGSSIRSGLTAGSPSGDHSGTMIGRRAGGAGVAVGRPGEWGDGARQVFMKRRVKIAVATLSLLLLRLLACATASDGDLAFFTATHDGDAYAKHPSDYDRLELPPSSGGGEVYVERAPALRIPFRDITAVVIERAEASGGAFGKAIEDVLRGIGRTTDVATYTATFALNEDGAKKVRGFIERYRSTLVEVRLNNVRIGVPTIVGQFTAAKEFAVVGLTDDTAKELRKELSSIEEKVIWK